MKALSVKQPWAEMIAQGDKTREYRSWPTKHRGPLLIVSGLREDAEAMDEARRQHYPEALPDMPRGVAVCLVDVVSCTWDEGEGCYAWGLANPRRTRNIAVKGKLGIFEVKLGDEDIFI